MFWIGIFVIFSAFLGRDFSENIEKWQSPKRLVFFQSPFEKLKWKVLKELNKGKLHDKVD